MSKAVKISTSVGSAERAQMAQQVFDRMRSGLSALKACKDVGLNQSTFNDWMNADKALSAEYARAREELQDLIADEVLDIADSPPGLTEHGSVDSGSVADKRLRVDSRKWYLSKVAPKKYGDKVTLAGDADNPLTVEKIQRVIISADAK